MGDKPPRTRQAANRHSAVRGGERSCNPPPRAVLLARPRPRPPAATPSTHNTHNTQGGKKQEKWEKGTEKKNTRHAHTPPRPTRRDGHLVIESGDRGCTSLEARVRLGRVPIAEAVRRSLVVVHNRRRWSRRRLMWRMLLVLYGLLWLHRRGGLGRSTSSFGDGGGGGRAVRLERLGDHGGLCRGGDLLHCHRSARRDIGKLGCDCGAL